MPRRKPLPVDNAKVFERIQQVTGVKNANQLSKYLGIKPAAVHEGLHGQIPEAWLYKIAALERVRVEYLRNGTGVVEPVLEFPMRAFLEAMQRKGPATAETLAFLLRCVDLIHAEGDEVREFLNAQVDFFERRRRPTEPQGDG